MSSTLTMTREVQRAETLVQQTAHELSRAQQNVRVGTRVTAETRALLDLAQMTAGFTVLVGWGLETNRPPEAWTAALPAMHKIFDVLGGLEQKLGAGVSHGVHPLFRQWFSEILEKLGDQIESIELGRDPDLHTVIRDAIRAVPPSVS